MAQIMDTAKNNEGEFKNRLAVIEQRLGPLEKTTQASSASRSKEGETLADLEYRLGSLTANFGGLETRIG